MAKAKTEKKTKELNEETKFAEKDFLMSYMPFLIIITFVIIIRWFVATPVRVNGSSMSPWFPLPPCKYITNRLSITKKLEVLDVLILLLFKLIAEN